MVTQILAVYPRMEQKKISITQKSTHGDTNTRRVPSHGTKKLA